MLSPTAGRTRMASLRQAWKKGRAWTSDHWGKVEREPEAVALSSSDLMRE